MGSDPKKSRMELDSEMNAEIPSKQPGVTLMSPTDVVENDLTPICRDLERLQHLSASLCERFKQVERDLACAMSEVEETERMWAASLDVQGCMQTAKHNFFNCENGLRKLLSEFNDILDQLECMHRAVLNQHISLWHRNQRLGNGSLGLGSRLDEIQETFEMFADVIRLNLDIAEKFEVTTCNASVTNISIKEDCTNTVGRLRRLQQELFKGAFVVEKQPPQVLKTNTRFSTSIRLLLGVRPEVGSEPILVKVSIINETQASEVPESCDHPTAGELQNSSQYMKYDGTPPRICADFQNVSLTSFKRAQRKCSSRVVDDKLCLLYEAVIEVGTMRFEVKTRSLPIVVIVHGTQEAAAWGSIFWDNHFSLSPRDPLSIPAAVPWTKMAESLSMTFSEATGRELDEEQLLLLAMKAFGGDCGDNQDLQISFSQFCGAFLPGRSFTFCEWLYAIMRFIKDHFRDPWIEGSIIGFIGRNETEALLQNEPVGSFLLRFSESVLGAISIAYVSEHFGHRKIIMIQPLTTKDLQLRSLAHRIADVPSLRYLYPRIPKEKAFPVNFEQDRRREKPSSHGYVEPRLVFAIAATQPNSLPNPSPNLAIPTIQPFS